MVEDIVDWSLDNYNIISGAAIGTWGGVSAFYWEKSDKKDTEDIPIEISAFTGGAFWGTILESSYSFEFGDNDYDPEVAASAAITATVVYRTLSRLDKQYLASGKDRAEEVKHDLEESEAYDENPEELFNF